MPPAELGNLTAKQLGETPASAMTYRQAIVLAIITSRMNSLVRGNAHFDRTYEVVAGKIAEQADAILAREAHESSFNNEVIKESGNGTD